MYPNLNYEKINTINSSFLIVAVGFNVLAQSIPPTCKAAAQEKKLAGAAKISFLKKCEKDATDRCDAAATERKLAGAAKTSNMKKCVKDAVGE